MQHTQYNFIRLLLVAGLLVAGDSAFAGRIVQQGKPDPILDGGDTHACLAGADLVPGVDVTGQPVIPADAGAGPVPLPDQVLVPVGREPARPAGRRGRAPLAGSDNGLGNGPYIALDGRRLAPLLDPGPCPR